MEDPLPTTVLHSAYGRQKQLEENAAQDRSCCRIVLLWILNMRTLIQNQDHPGICRACGGLMQNSAEWQTTRQYDTTGAEIAGFPHANLCYGALKWFLDHDMPTLVFVPSQNMNWEAVMVCLDQLENSCRDAINQAQQHWFDMHWALEALGAEEDRTAPIRRRIKHKQAVPHILPPLRGPPFPLPEGPAPAAIG